MISFVESVETPEIWFNQAWEMFEASKAVYESFSNCQSVRSDKDRHRRNGLMKGTMLLLGLAVENGLKGAVIYQSKPDLSNNKLDFKHFHQHAHDLKDTAKKIDLRLSSNQEKYLDRLSMFVVWASKYKAPLKQADFDNSRGEVKMQYPSDFDAAENFINVLQSKSGYSVENGWPYKS